MQINILESLSSVTAEQWNALNTDDNPFLRYEFLHALENTACVGGKTGWTPQHIVAYRENKLIAAIPTYIKHHSYGEYIFDWAWANAYEHHGLAYYPKLLIGVPFTPATGHRLLLSPELEDSNSIANTLIQYCKDHAYNIGASSIHCLFNLQSENQYFAQQHFMTRETNQFHWQNNNYSSFDDYLQSLSSRHRKKIRRERQRINEQRITVELKPASSVTDKEWQQFFRFYTNTCYFKGGTPYLNHAFFRELAHSLEHDVLLAVARHDSEVVAAAFFMTNKNTLYGRYWGSNADYHSLHFEACYYAPIEYCIQHQYKHFEAGAQGEHKLSRGFLPTTIYSNHWIAHEQFREAIQHYLQHEKQHTQLYQQELSKLSPFKSVQ